MKEIGIGRDRPFLPTRTLREKGPTNVYCVSRRSERLWLIWSHQFKSYIENATANTASLYLIFQQCM